MVSTFAGLEYSRWFIEKYINSLSWKRKFLARFFDKYKVTQQEYLRWYMQELLKNEYL